MLQNFNIRITAGNTNAKFLLDAVSLTNPGTLGLYQPEIAGVLDVHRSHRGNMIHRMEAIVRDTSGSGNPFPNLRMLLFPEQIPRYACWLTSRLGHLLLDSVSQGSVIPYMTTGSATDLNSAGVMHADFASGAYYYPIFRDHSRPTLNTTNEAQYYASITQQGSAGFVEMGLRLRLFVERRNQFNPALPWIPWIQNHSQLYETDPPAHTDGLPHREPSAAELRQECNTALALGARGVMFYTFASIPWKTTDPFWPPDTTTWRADTTGGAPRQLDPDMGLLGFLADGNLPRRCDWNGEDKWDSTRTYISDFLKPIGNFIIDEDLRWRSHKFWHLTTSQAGNSDFVRVVFSERQDLPIPHDSVQFTWVQTSEFDAADGAKYLFVLNGRTHPEGQRHITIKPAPADGEREWKITQVRGPGEDGDIWIVRPTESPDNTSYNNGFTDYFEPGQARLYRLEEIEDETTDFVFDEDAPCAERNVYIEPAAKLNLKSTDVLAFTPGHGLFCDGRLEASGTAFRPCDLESTWTGIVARNNADVKLHGVTISAAGVIAGSDAFVTLDSSCSILNTYAAFTNMGATIRSTGTVSTSVASHLISTGSGRSVLTRDESTGASYPTATAIDVLQNSQHVKTDECMFSGFWRGVRLEEATLVGDADEDFPADGGNNSIRATQWGLMAMVKSEIDFGTSVSVPSWESLNEIVLTNGTGYHAAVDGTSIIYARQCWWDPVDTSSTPPINILGNDVEYLARLTIDPIPFTGGGGASFTGPVALGKTTASPLPVDVRGLIKQALAQRDPGRVRHLGGQFLQSSAAMTADFKLLSFLHRALRTADARGNVDSLLALCLSRTDVESKLLAADIVSEDSLYSDALQVLNSYSFAGSTEMTKRALVRKALLYPRAYHGGYRDGLLVIDSLRSMHDSTLLRFVETYPLLYSRLSHGETSIIPKRAATSFIYPSLPSTVDVWPNYPNPFRDVTSFTFKLGEDMHVRLAVYDAMGREVAVVTDTDYSRGVHSVLLRSVTLPSGLYFYRLTTDQGVIQRKMLLMR